MTNTENSANNHFLDELEEWIKNATPDSHDIVEIDEYVADGISYKVDGINVKHNNSKRELEVAEIIKSTFGGKVELVPEVKGKYKGVSTPDYCISGEKWDLKELKGESKDAIRNAISKKRKQADNFIIDITESKLDIAEVQKQAENVFSAHNTKFVNRLMIIKDNEILRIIKRQ